ncbi:hypothetical protein F4779DRAFT_627188 [Xylariaceae sp. FL0662B]|nr:hypothetical protein F4779DRAFT_627188 [Xylariaceae sp. FL0662B]
MGNLNSPLSGKVLLTGGSGFIASHILDTLLENGFDVVVTTRSEQKGRRIVESVDAIHQKHLSYVVVTDISRVGAFDAVFKLVPSFDYVVHTASPYHLDVQDPVKDFLGPAVRGTEGLLKSIKKHCPTVKRVVITSSSAAMLNPDNHARVYDETCWFPVTWEEAMIPKNTYKASKVFSEKAAWAFMEAEKPNFDLVVINGTFTFGPIQRTLPSLDDINTSNQRIRDMIQGKMREALEPTAPVFTFVDVRDVALAHLKAMTVPAAGGHRIYVVAGHFSNKRIADIIIKSHPELSTRLPPEDAADDFPADVYGYNNARSRDILGMEYLSLEKSINDTVKSILHLGHI